MTFLNRYRQIEPHIKQLIAGVFCMQFTNSTFFVLLNFFMSENGYEDHAIAGDYFSVRFLAVFFLAFPLGLFIKGRRLKRFILTGSIVVPIAAYLIMFSIANQWNGLLKCSMVLWGVGFLMLQVCNFPFVLLNAKKETHSEAISMLFMTWSTTSLIVGLASFILGQLNPVLFSTKNLMLIFISISCLSAFFIARINIKENISEKFPLLSIRTNYNWNLIAKAIFPTVLIAIGAGFTIPFINLFFQEVHGMSANTYSFVHFLTFALVICALAIIPSIKRKFGYSIAITLTQSLAVVSLIIIATTAFFPEYKYAIYIAALFFMLRQPLMNVAAPMTTELSMYYVGKQNQELISALTASIWSGSWFISSAIFGVLRANNVSYGHILLMTAGFYVVGILAYQWLIQSYARRQKLTSECLSLD